MSLPATSVTPLDGGMVPVPSSSAKVVAKIGAASLGTPLAVQSWGGPNLSAMVDALGTGPMVEAAAQSLSSAGGPIITVPATKSAAGSAGAVTHLPALNCGTSVMTLTAPAGGTCAPNDGYALMATITRAALTIAGGGGAFTYTLDGVTQSAEVAVPASGQYTIPGTGLRLNFAEGTLVVGDTYASTCTAPAPSVSDVVAAIESLVASQYQFGAIHVVGAPSPSKTAVTHTGTGPYSAVDPINPVLSGTPTDFIDAVWKITTAGALNTAKGKLSIDGGLTYPGLEILMPTGGVTSVGHGLTLTFLAGSYIQDDLYKFNTYGSIASLFAAVDAQMTAAALAYKWAFAILELPSATDALIAKALAGLASAEGRVMVTGGFCTLASATSSPGGASYSRPDGWPIAARVAGSEISEDLGRVKSGPVGGISALARDEQVTPGFGVLHVETLRTIPGRNGIYIASDTDGNMMSAVGSDYSFVQFRRIMDRACVLALPVAQGELNDDILADPVTGFILASEADRIEGIIDAAVRSELMSSSNALRKPHVSALLVSVKRDEAILLTKNITVDIALVPKGYAKSIGVYIHYSLSLPASVAAAA